MKNSELLAILSALPGDADVRIVYDGGVRSDVDAAWLTRSGVVALAPVHEYVTDDDHRTVDAPDESEVHYLPIHQMMGLPEPRDD